MTIDRFFDQDVVVARLRNDGSIGENYHSTATVEAHVQSLDDREANLLNIQTGRAFQAWFDVDTDIKEGDRIRDEAGKEYDIQEVTKWTYGTNQHLHVIMTEYNAD